LNIWSEKFTLPQSTIDKWKERYSDDYFLTVKEDKKLGAHYTGYHRGKEFLDKELLSTYVPILKSVLKKFGLNGMFSYSSIWGQYYKKEMNAVITPHSHFNELKDLISWIHFLDVPDQKCFYFLVGDQKIYPETQRKSDIMFYPSYAIHGVDKLMYAKDRLVIVGNITKLL
tara:strand:+ start:2579 stop:3091 length:513 start_codon:yes stop_codon:yes gene_type:complete